MYLLFGSEAHLSPTQPVFPTWMERLCGREEACFLVKTPEPVFQLLCVKQAKRPRFYDAPSCQRDLGSHYFNS